MVALANSRSDALQFERRMLSVFEKRNSLPPPTPKYDDALSPEWIDNFFATLPSSQEVLLLARNYIERGWCKGRYEISTEEQKGERYFGGLVPKYWETSEPRVCSVGAIRAAIQKLGYVGNEGILVERVSKAAGIKPGEGPLTRWNDDPKRTQEQVIAAFDRAIVMVAEF